MQDWQAEGIHIRTLEGRERGTKEQGEADIRIQSPKKERKV